MSGGIRFRARHGRLQFLARECLKRVRVPPEFASRVADAMIGANLMGIDRDGVAWLPDLVDAIATRHVRAAPRIEEVSSSGSTLVLDGDNGPGPVAAHRGMQEAISGANRQGVGAAAVRGGNRFGAPAHFARLALPHQMAGVMIESGAPTESGAAAVRLGIAIPTEEMRAPVVLDRDLAGEDSDMGLALALEALAGLAGAALPDELTSPRPDPVHRGQAGLFLAFRIRAFAPWAGFRNRMAARLGALRRAHAGYPGQDEWAVEEERRTHGIPVREEVAASLERLASRLEVRPIWDELAGRTSTPGSPESRTARRDARGPEPGRMP